MARFARIPFFKKNERSFDREIFFSFVSRTQLDFLRRRVCTRDSLLACSLLLIASKALSPFYRAAERRLLPGTLGTLGNEVGKEIFKQTPPSLRRHKRGGMEPKVGSKDVASLHEGSPNSFHGQLQLAFMPRFAYRSKIISRTLSLIFVSDVSAG